MAKHKALYQWTGFTILGFFLMHLLGTVTLFNVSLLAGPPFFNLPIIGRILHRIILSICQWLILKHHFSQSYLWVVLTAVSTLPASVLQRVNATLILSISNAFINHPTYQIRVLYIGLIVSSAISALFPAVMQWFYLRTRVKKAWPWIVYGTLASWLTSEVTAARVLIKYDLSLSTDISIFIGMVIWNGMLYGLITGIPIVSYVKQQQTGSELNV